jgi:hypothetical protein
MDALAGQALPPSAPLAASRRTRAPGRAGTHERPAYGGRGRCGPTPRTRRRHKPAQTPAAPARPRRRTAGHPAARRWHGAATRQPGPGPLPAAGRRGGLTSRARPRSRPSRVGPPSPARRPERGPGRRSVPTRFSLVQVQRHRLLDHRRPQPVDLRGRRPPAGWPGRSTPPHISRTSRSATTDAACPCRSLLQRTCQPASNRVRHAASCWVFPEQMTGLSQTQDTQGLTRWLGKRRAMLLRIRPVGWVLPRAGPARRATRADTGPTTQHARASAPVPTVTRSTDPRGTGKHCRGGPET